MTTPSQIESAIHSASAGGSNSPTATEGPVTQTARAVGAQLPPAKPVSESKGVPPGEPDHTSSQDSVDAQRRAAAGVNFPDSQRCGDTQNSAAVGDPTSTDSHQVSDTHTERAVRGSISPTSQPGDEHQKAIAGWGSNFPGSGRVALDAQPQDATAGDQATRNGHKPSDTHICRAVSGSNSPTSHACDANQKAIAGWGSTEGESI